MAIFHYPFTDMKLSASCPLFSLIISFINPDQGSPSTLEASTRKSFQDHKQSSFGAQKKNTELILLKAEMCKHKKSISKEEQKQEKERKKDGKDSQLKRKHQKWNKKIEGQKSGEKSST